MKLNSVLLKDSLYNTHEKSGAPIEYARGIVVGIASTLMVTKNISLFDALDIIKRHLPEGYRKESFPDSWR